MVMDDAARWLASGMVVGCLVASAGADPRPSTTTRAGVERVALSSGFYLLVKPSGYAHGDRPPLIVCLHETDTGAEEILAFWRRLETPIGVVLAAPQHHMPGWREADLPCIRAMLAHLAEHVTYDADRVLLTGYSAGGAMAFHLAYVEGFPATAVAATANYVPPSVTADRVAGRRDLPVFYAVGTRDVNHDRMRASIELLQANGGPLTLLRPDIGHRLDPVVGQQAADWFAKTSDRQAQRRIDRAERAVKDRTYAAGLALVEPIVAQRRWHPAKTVRRAGSVRDDLERPGRERLADAARLTRQGQSLAAVDVLREVETAYGRSRVGEAARDRRETLLADPKVRSDESARRAEREEQAARRSLRRAQQFVVDGQFAQAKQQCRSIIRSYPDSTAATRARTLLDQIRRAGR